MKYLFSLMLMCASLLVQAGVEVHQFNNPEQEARYRTLIQELRCLVCQNQNLADSNAELALDLRQQTYDMIMQGATNPQIVDYMVSRYGDFVLYRPPVQGNTLLLWGGPFLVLILGLVIVFRYVRRQSHAVEPGVSSPEISSIDQTRARQLLYDGEPQV